MTKPKAPPPPAAPAQQLTVVPEYSHTAAALASLGEKYGKTVFEVATTKGMTAAREARAEIKAYRVNLEKMRVEIKAPALERCRLIDAEAKRIAGELLALETPIDEAIKAQEAIKDAERQAKVDAERERLAKIERERLAAEQAEREASINAEREKLAAERAEFERQRAEAAAADEQRRKDADLALAAQRAAEAERVAAERKAYDEQVAAERKAEAERQAEARRIEAEQKAERDRLAQEERDRLAAERQQLEEQKAEEARRKHANMLIDLKAHSTDLAAAAIEAHQFLCANGYADHTITLALGFAIEHNAAQQQLPLADPKPDTPAPAKKAAAKKPTTKKGAKA